MKNSNEPYQFLFKTIRVLVVEKKAAISQPIVAALKLHPIYEVTVAKSNREAMAELSLPSRYHVCISSFGLTDLQKDEFYLLKKFARHVAFCMIADQATAGQGFIAARLGARAIFAANDKSARTTLLHLISRWALITTLNPCYMEHGGDTLSFATDILVERIPKSVTYWAAAMNMTDRELRFIWKKHMGANAKIILAIHRLLQRALDYYNSLAAGHTTTSSQKTALCSTDEYKHLHEYFFTHRTIILDYLAFGNVVTFTN